MDARELTKKMYKLEDDVFVLKKKNTELIQVVNKLLLMVGDIDNKDLKPMMIDMAVRGSNNDSN